MIVLDFETAPDSVIQAWNAAVLAGDIHPSLHNLRAFIRTSQDAGTP